MFYVLVLFLIPEIICGCITSSINQNKGYDGGFWWGFFLGILGIIVVACRPFNANQMEDYYGYPTNYGPYNHPNNAPYNNYPQNNGAYNNYPQNNGAYNNYPQNNRVYNNYPTNNVAYNNYPQNSGVYYDSSQNN